jgi:hypothetical protein
MHTLISLLGSLELHWTLRAIQLLVDLVITSEF